MSALAKDARMESERRRLSTYLSQQLERAAELALGIHADYLSIEHLVGAVLRDEESAANQTIVFAFADPETVGMELLALAPGILVVGSASTRPFSPRAVEALDLARRWAAACATKEVEAAILCAAAASVLPAEIQEALRAAGYHEPTQIPPAPPAANVPLSDAAKQALSHANRASGRAGEASIGPARILHAGLQADRAVESALGLTAARAHSILEGAFLDATPPPHRELAADESLLAFLTRLPAGAGSLEVLAACHHESTPELAELLLRHKLAPDLLRRAAAELSDPE